MSKLKRRVTSTALALLLCLSCVPLSPFARAYSDCEDTWAADVIQKASDYGLMNGYPDGRFGVGEQMRRGEFAAVMCRMFGWELVEPETPSYKDCPASHWAFSYIETAAAHAAVDCIGYYRPDAYIRRGEMAKMLVRALGLDALARSSTASSLSLPFTDVTKDQGYIALAYDCGIIRGVPSENDTLKFLPNDSAPREQAAAMLVRCYERLQLQTDWINGFYADLPSMANSQIELADQMSVVSVGWGRLRFGAEDESYTFTTSSANGNSWYVPDDADAVTDYLAQQGVECHFSVQSTAEPFARTVDAGQVGSLIADLVAAAEPYDGLDIDFEGLSAKRREAFTAFITDLRAALPADKALTVCVPSDKYQKGYDFRALGDVCDKIIYMAHSHGWTSVPAYYVGGTDTYSPPAPLDEVYRDLHSALDPDTGVRDPSKLALQICIGSAGFQVDENGCLLSQTIYRPGPSTLAKRLRQETTVREWDAQAASPCLNYENEAGDLFKVWYEDAESISAKLSLARMLGVTGVSVWRMGAIPPYEDIPGYDVRSLFQLGG